MLTQDELRRLRTLYARYHGAARAMLTARDAYVAAAVSLMRREGRKHIAMDLEMYACNWPHQMPSNLEWLESELTETGHVQMANG